MTDSDCSNNCGQICSEHQTDLSHFTVKSLMLTTRTEACLLRSLTRVAQHQALLPLRGLTVAMVTRPRHTWAPVLLVAALLGEEEGRGRGRWGEYGGDGEGRTEEGRKRELGSTPIKGA